MRPLLWELVSGWGLVRVWAGRVHWAATACTVRYRLVANGRARPEKYARTGRAVELSSDLLNDDYRLDDRCLTP